MALDNGIKEQLKQYLAMLESEIVFAASLGTDDASQKVRDFLEEIAKCRTYYDRRSNCRSDTKLYNYATRYRQWHCFCRSSTRA